jgi:carboxyl-terminal processing protease
VTARHSRTGNRWLALIFGLALVMVGVWLGGHPGWIPSSLRSFFLDDRHGRLADEVLGDLSRDYYRPVNLTALLDKGLTAAVASLKDPYSHYFDPATYKLFLNQTNPHVSGIGIDVQSDPRGLLVIDVFPGSPAARAGLQRSDVIEAVGTTKLAGRTDVFASGLIKGRPGTKVTLTIGPAGGGKPRSVTITRAAVVVPVTSSQIVRRLGLPIGDVALTSFTDGSGGQIRSQVEKVLRQGARAIVLDLREDGGGLLEEAIKVASVFIPDGTIVSTAGRSQPRQVYTAEGHAISGQIPVVVVVDRGTASAAEIVAGALQDRHRGKVVGVRTYGKGVFQEIRNLSNGGALDITVGEYFTPSGHNLGGGGVRQGAGIQPDVRALDNPHTKRDEGLDVALQVVTDEIK